MRCNVAFKPSVDGLESRKVLSTMTLGFGAVAPHFIVVGQPPHVFPTGPGLLTPYTHVTTSQGIHVDGAPSYKFPTMILLSDGVSISMHGLRTTR
jgi:hypothetical protein